MQILKNPIEYAADLNRWFDNDKSVCEILKEVYNIFGNLPKEYIDDLQIALETLRA